MAEWDDRRSALLRELFGGAAGVPVGVEGRMLRTREVAVLFEVSDRAVTDWAQRGRIPSVRTPGGHRRYPADLVLAMLVDRDQAAGAPAPAPAPAAAGAAESASATAGPGADRVVELRDRTAPGPIAAAPRP